MASMTSNRSGFTLAELVIAVVLSAVVMVFVYSFLKKSTDATQAGEGFADVQQNLRVVGEILADNVRQTGYGIDFGNGQQGLVHAGPWDIVFNANLSPEPDVFGDARVPVAMDPAGAPSAVPATGPTLYSPARAFGTGAETVYFTLDSNGDGAVTTADQGDDDEEDAGGPRDYILSRHVYGSDSLGSNGGAREKIALCAGPSPDYGVTTLPVFQYLYDHDDDPTTPLLLWGDASGNLALESSEISAITAVPAATLPQVQRIRITLLGDTRDLSGTDGRVAASGDGSSTFRTEVAIRNKPRTLAIVKGIVFSDNNQDGVRQSGEAGISGAQIRLSSGHRITTGPAGIYYFEVEPGSHSVAETDAPGYTSTTPNLVSVNVTPGEVRSVDFGDRPTSGLGWIKGVVWNDANNDTTIDFGENGIRNVLVYLNTGDRDTTDSSGRFSFHVPVTSYTVTEIDSAGYVSTTSNQVNVTIPADGDTVYCAFGDRQADAVGVIEGTVFLDENENGIQDGGEGGIPQVTIRIDGDRDSTLTDSQGYYRFTLDVGSYDVEEVDLEDYVSTTANIVYDVYVEQDSTVVVNFGDRAENQLSFEEIILSNSVRALSVGTADFKEDGRGDVEIILGTKYVAGQNNINAYFNSWVNSNTPNSSIFSGTPTYTCNGTADVGAIGIGLHNGDLYPDVVTGLYATNLNVKSWLTQTGGSNKGKLPSAANYTYSTGLGAQVLAVAVGDVRGTSAVDLVVGTRVADGQGRLEVWTGAGTGTFSLGALDTYTLSAGDVPLGEPYGIAIGQIDGTGGNDIAIATRTGYYTGRIEVFLQNGSSGQFVPTYSYAVSGQANAIALKDMKEDGANDKDIVVATSRYAGGGEIELWLNDGRGQFGVFDPNTYSSVKSDSIAVGGEVISISVSNMDPDVYPDVCAGLKTFSGYTGSLVVYRGFGYLPNSGTAWSGSEIGEVVAMDTNDFNKDGKMDVVVGTRTGSTTGKLVVYFQQ